MVLFLKKKLGRLVLYRRDGADDSFYSKHTIASFSVRKENGRKHLSEYQTAALNNRKGEYAKIAPSSIKTHMKSIREENQSGGRRHIKNICLP